MLRLNAPPNSESAWHSPSEASSLVVGVSHFAGIFVSSNEKKCDILSPVFDEEPSQDSNPYAPPRLSKQRTN